MITTITVMLIAVMVRAAAAAADDGDAADDDDDNSYADAGLIGAECPNRAGLQAAYVPIVVPASAVAARLRGPWGVLRTPLALGVLTDSDHAQMMSAVPARPRVRAPPARCARKLT